MFVALRDIFRKVSYTHCTPLAQWKRYLYQLAARHRPSFLSTSEHIDLRSRAGLFFLFVTETVIYLCLCALGNSASLYQYMQRIFADNMHTRLIPMLSLSSAWTVRVQIFDNSCVLSIFIIERTNLSSDLRYLDRTLLNGWYVQSDICPNHTTRFT